MITDTHQQTLSRRQKITVIIIVCLMLAVTIVLAVTIFIEDNIKTTTDNTKSSYTMVVTSTEKH